jgi:hypothetical protein
MPDVVLRRSPSRWINAGTSQSTEVRPSGTEILLRAFDLEQHRRQPIATQDRTRCSSDGLISGHHDHRRAGAIEPCHHAQPAMERSRPCPLLRPPFRPFGDDARELLSRQGAVHRRAPDASPWNAVDRDQTCAMVGAYASLSVPAARLSEGVPSISHTPLRRSLDTGRAACCA